jgi:hypothetical protein
MLKPTRNRIDLEQMLHPACGYDHPSQLLQESDLTLNEKRAVLAAWASDACAVEAEPALRLAPGGRRVPVDDILQALRELDRQAGWQSTTRAGRYRKAVREHRRAAQFRVLDRRAARSPQSEGRAAP